MTSSIRTEKITQSTSYFKSIHRLYNLYEQSGFTNVFIRDILIVFLMDYTQATIRLLCASNMYLDDNDTEDDILQTIMVTWLKILPKPKAIRWKLYHLPKATLQYIGKAINSRNHPIRRNLVYEYDFSRLQCSGNYFEDIDDQVFKRLAKKIKYLYVPIKLFNRKYDAVLKKIALGIDIFNDFTLSSKSLCALCKNFCVGRHRGRLLYYFLRADMKRHFSR